VSIHRADCKLLEKSEHANERMVEASWEGDKVLEIAMWVSTGARPNVLADLTNAMRPLNLDVTHAEYRPGDGGDAVFVFVFETTDESKIERATKALRNVSGVTAVSTIPAKESAQRKAE
jgi:GTP pyrophosphokinase